MEKSEKTLKEFIGGMELTILNDEDSILLDGMVGTSGMQNACNSDHNCSSCDTTNNCHGGNCVAGCSK